MNPVDFDVQSLFGADQNLLVLDHEGRIEGSLIRQQQRTFNSLQQISTDRQWADFYERHAIWYSARLAEGGFVYPILLDPGSEVHYRTMFGIDETELQAERDYFKICQAQHAVTWDNGRPLISPLMSDCIVPQQNGHQIDELRELGRSVGWTDKEVKAVSTLTNAGDHARERTQSIAGRWITKPEYLSQLASLRQHWEELSVENRPRFPLQRPSFPENEIPAHRILRSPKIDQFGQLLTSFLDRWQLMQLTTWEIAEPQGLLVISPEGVAKGEHSMSIPMAFPLQIQDGVGPEQIRLHELLAKNREIEDLSRFDTYRQIWRIDFLENILQRRYTEFRQKRGFQSKLLSLIGKYLDLDTDRIKKYRSWRNRLRTGETSSLRGLR